VIGSGSRHGNPARELLQISGRARPPIMFRACDISERNTYQAPPAAVTADAAVALR